MLLRAYLYQKWRFEHQKGRVLCSFWEDVIMASHYNELIDRKIRKWSNASHILADEIAALLKCAAFLLKTLPDILSALSFFVILE